MRAVARGQRYPDGGALTTEKIAVVADKLWRGRRTGIGRATAGLTAGLVEHGRNAIVIGYRDRGSGPDDRYAVAVHEIPIPRQVSTAMSLVGLGINIERLVKPKVTIVHNSNIAAPVRTRLPSVVTVHDLGPIDLPAEYSARVRRMFRESVRMSEDRGDVAFCVSEATASRLIERFPGFDDRVVVGPLGPSLFPQLSNETRPTPMRILFVGEITRRKRPDLVVRAFEQAGLPPGWRLTIAGNPGNAFEPTMRLIEKSPVRSRIGVAISPSDDDLARLYAESRCLVLPSDLEGFGLPVLDAIAIGLPVVVTDGSSLPEVAGAGGIVIPRGSVEDLARAMHTLALDGEAHERFSRAGLDHARRFSWWTHAEAALEAYRRAEVLNS